MKSAGTRCRSARSAAVVWAAAPAAAVRKSASAAAIPRATNDARMGLSMYMLSPRARQHTSRR